MRKILLIENTKTTVNGCEKIHDLKTVWWCILDSETKTTYRIKHLGCSVYLDRKFTGIDERFYIRKPVSVPKSDFRKSKSLKAETLNRMFKKAFSDSYQRYVSSLKNLKGVVRWFNRSSGDGYIRIPELNKSVTVYACNLKGAKTGFAETACVYLEEGAEVVVDYVHEHCGAILKTNENPIKFDSEHWNRLDQDNLSFKCDEDGNFITGLFK